MTNAPPAVHPVIALVASAGGLEAVSRVLSALPAQLGASVLVLIHQQPDRVSRLTELLGRSSTLPVAAAEHEEPLLPGRVVVVPPGKHVLITPALTTAVIGSGPAPPNRPSADLLLATLATAVRDRAIAVVLSGGGHDGATGATAVHLLGGAVVATDEASSAVFSMPRSTIERDDTIDHVVSLDEVPGLLASLVAG